MIGLQRYCKEKESFAYGSKNSKREKLREEGESLHCISFGVIMNEVETSIYREKCEAQPLRSKFLAIGSIWINLH